MSVAGAVILLLTAGFVGVSAGLIYRGQTALIAGYDAGAENADGAKLGRWFGARLSVLAIATVGLAIAELRGEATDAMWVGYAAVTIALSVWLHVGMRRRFLADSSPE